MPPSEEPVDAESVDESLLARLNALRPSPISLSQKPLPVPNINADVERLTVPTDLAARFAKLGNISASSSATDPNKQTFVASSISQDIPHSTEHNLEDDRTLDELFSDVGPREQWDISKDEELGASSLVNEAKEALDKAQELNATKDEPNALGTDDMVQGDEERQAMELKEEEEADEYVRRVLAEIELEKQQGESPPDQQGPESNTEEAENQPWSLSSGKDALNIGRSSSEDGSAGSANNDDTVMDLPSAPTDTLLSSDGHDKPGISLPSAPTSKPNSSLPTYTDEEIDTWCIICNDDATVRCLGCDGDLYCSSCWNEGHRGRDAGFEERTHKAMAYVKPKPPQSAKKSKQRKLAA